MKTNAQLLAAETMELTGEEALARTFLRFATERHPCPSCGVATSQVEAAKLQVNDWPLDGFEVTGPRRARPRLQCPACRVDLVYGTRIPARGFLTRNHAIALTSLRVARRAEELKNDAATRGAVVAGVP